MICARASAAPGRIPRVVGGRKRVGIELCATLEVQACGAHLAGCCRDSDYDRAKIVLSVIPRDPKARRWWMSITFDSILICVRTKFDVIE
ncbi:hypothetical protein BHE74_00018101 [Ensete ventricosum]|uniref:Uncharacterized protein n=1 Tax=Ensete ventricosum TaxID=4639 RepID=A0A426YB43_ENSVE|nr:hypothetical protein B296_00026129 [Ensete ventricosum]RWW27550.1 hypothetical protein GW17_00008012 [Ensete ventricosum]RWW73985.1 hypothetical protein BHE74_00018101 [Ensete ventricosum]